MRIVVILREDIMMCRVSSKKALEDVVYLLCGDGSHHLFSCMPSSCFRDSEYCLWCIFAIGRSLRPTWYVE